MRKNTSRFQRYLIPMVLLGMIISLLLPRGEEVKTEINAEQAAEQTADKQLQEGLRSYGSGTGRVYGLTDNDRREFNLGANPERRILQELGKRPELIPQEAVLGGSMHFVLHESVVLNRHWVLAVFEDGHVRGQALFEYQINNQDEFSWKLLANQPD
ncbi:hypothetical protein [Marinospirillum insulare]|uniref:Uncharacterized protein n=1 Tax=Marinospirillum insulare TaxID=217169 RepID=A0ABQ6A4T6_9GAMM|nr:hypothetical protein [Marinospirillum insulare]GLR65208.1 hypothetical protein GCM10007878_26470 [Marinospirillum insulare]